MARWSRLGSTAHEALRSRRERLDGCADVGQHIANEQHQPRQQALHQAARAWPADSGFPCPREVTLAARSCPSRGWPERQLETDCGRCGFGLSNAGG